MAFRDMFRKRDTKCNIKLVTKRLDIIEFFEKVSKANKTGELQADFECASCRPRIDLGFTGQIYLAEEISIIENQVVVFCPILDMLKQRGLPHDCTNCK